ncbi:unnamed protein product, partial [Nesidiocoris tenuis]
TPTGGIPRVRKINSLPMIHAPGYESSAPSTCIGKQTRQTLGRMCKRCTNTQVGQYSPPLTRDKKPPFDRASPSTNIGEHSGEYPAVTLAGRGLRIFGVGPNNASVTAALSPGCHQLCQNELAIPTNLKKISVDFPTTARRRISVRGSHSKRQQSSLYYRLSPIRLGIVITYLGMPFRSFATRTRVLHGARESNANGSSSGNSICRVFQMRVGQRLDVKRLDKGKILNVGFPQVRKIMKTTPLEQSVESTSKILLAFFVRGSVLLESLPDERKNGHRSIPICIVCPPNTRTIYSRSPKMNLLGLKLSSVESTREPCSLSCTRLVHSLPFWPVWALYKA